MLARSTGVETARAAARVCWSHVQMSGKMHTVGVETGTEQPCRRSERDLLRLIAGQRCVLYLPSQALG